MRKDNFVCTSPVDDMIWLAATEGDGWPSVSWSRARPPNPDKAKQIDERCSAKAPKVLWIRCVSVPTGTYLGR